MDKLKFGKYDLFVSLGAACSCTQALRDSKLQFYSYPFDWIFGANIVERVKFLNNNFERFIDKQDLEFSYEEKSIKCNAYRNKFNNITFNHDFLKDTPFDEMHEKVLEKYTRRAKRLISQIKSSKKVMFVYMQAPNIREDVPEELLIESYNLLKSYFPGVKIHLLYLYCTPFENYKYKKISTNIDKLTFDYDAKNKEIPHAVNTKILDTLFCKYSISLKHLTKENRKDMLSYKTKMFFRRRFWQNMENVSYF